MKLLIYVTVLMTCTSSISAASEADFRDAFKFLFNGGKSQKISEEFTLSECKASVDFVQMTKIFDLENFTPTKNVKQRVIQTYDFNTVNWKSLAYNTTAFSVECSETCWTSTAPDFRDIVNLNFAVEFIEMSPGVSQERMLRAVKVLAEACPGQVSRF